ncbi:nitroreductase family protein [Peribacillus butanolivorans]|uniref:nitroreductase family protein n=1 Tax=Peribacillus butanolivorans TaxID=421767 RepID=UPI0035D9DA8A
MHREDWDIKSRRNMAHWGGEIQQFLGMNNRTKFPISQSQLFNAPALVYLSIPKKSSYWSIFDLGAFSQTFMLSAYGRGIGSMPAYEIVKYPELVRQFIEIPDDQTIAMGVALGYPDEKKINGFVSDREEIEKMIEIKN